MALPGRKTRNFTWSTLITSLVGNKTVDGVLTGTYQIDVDDFAEQLLADGPLAQEIDILKAAAVGGQPLSVAIVNEVIGARDGAASLDTRLDADRAARAATSAEVASARAGSLDLAARLDADRLASGEASDAEALAGMAPNRLSPRRFASALIGALSRQSKLALTGGSIEFALAGYLLAVVSNADDVMAAVTRGGNVKAVTYDLPDGSQISVASTVWDVVFVDGNDFILCGWRGGVFYGSQAQPGFDVSSRNANALAYASAVRSDYDASVTRPVYDLDIMWMYGQSLSTGQEAWPALSKTPRFGNLMYGSSVRSKTAESPVFLPYGDAEVLNPLVATVDAYGTMYTDTQVAAFAPGDDAFGENPIVGFVNQLKFLHNQRLVLANDPRSFVAASGGVGGRTIEQLSKINTQDATNRYGRYTSAIQRIKAIATAQGKTVGVAAICWVQGEYNYSDKGGSWDKETYKSLFATLITAMQSDAMAETGQTQPPIFISYQTTGADSRDVDSAGNPGLHVAMAQLDVLRNRPGAYLATPSYPYTDKGVHLGPNGSRWMGAQMAKVAHIVVNLGQGWAPFEPIAIERSGSKIYVSYHVPRPPLRFLPAYISNAATLYDNKGFRVTDTGGDNPIVSVRIVAPTVIEITTVRPAGASELLWYADKSTHNGNGNVADSDDFVALDKFEWTAGTGHYASENIPALIGKPYDMANFSNAFCRPTDNWSL